MMGWRANQASFRGCNRFHRGRRFNPQTFTNRFRFKQSVECEPNWPLLSIKSLRVFSGNIIVGRELPTLNQLVSIVNNGDFCQ